MKNRTRACSLALCALLLLTLSVAGCGSKVPETTEPSSEQPSAETTTTESTSAGEAPTNSQGETLYTPEYKPNGRETATFKTSKGEVVAEFYGTNAPVHVGNFIELAQKGFYDNTKFHRYEPGFVIQGGDPQTTALSSESVVSAVQNGNPPLGTGGPGYVIKGEFDPKTNPQKHEVGALGMARTSDPDSAGSQFYFALEPLPMLDGQYTVFGRVTKGLEVVRELRVGDTIESVTIDGSN